MSQAPRIITNPVPGFYKVRLVPKGWLVPAVIFFDDQRYSLELDGKAVPGSWTSDDLEAIAADSLVLGRLWEHPLLAVSCFGESTTEADYRWRIDTKRWAADHDLGHPCLAPRKPMDPATLPATDF